MPIPGQETLCHIKTKAVDAVKKLDDKLVHTLGKLIGLDEEISEYRSPSKDITFDDES